MIQFQLPEKIEEDLRNGVGDLDEAARDAFLIQSYRDGRLSVGQIGEILGIGVLGAEGWLAERKVELNYSLEDLEADTRTLAELFPDTKL
jgi:predicted HTH domain antitoxin